MKSLGIPYANAGMDAHGYFVQCPVCPHKSRGCDESKPMAEDALTKGASSQHALHWLEQHTTEEA
jgi:hypothetical protein